MSRNAPTRRSFLRAAVAMACAALATPVIAGWNPPSPKLVQVDVYDRTSATALPVYTKDGRVYVVGTPGHEYAVRIRNCTGSRILAVTSVDGINVVTGETASPEQSGYVLEPWGSVEIAGWRKSMRETAAFFFSEHSQSYAARTGRPFDVGVIGVAAFAEKRAPIPRVSMHEQKREANERPKDSRDAAAELPASAPPLTRAESARADAQASEALGASRQAPAPLAKLGTGHGRTETSHAWRTTFERATAEPAQVAALHYDRHANLVALGVIPAPAHIARTPRPFPGMRFVPDPR
jgi:hypothetical protein